MQAECLAEYLRGVRGNRIGAVSTDVASTASLMSCVNAHLYGSLGEHLVERPGEASVTGKAFLEARLIVKVLEKHAEAVQAHANRARSLDSEAPTTAFERDLDQFVQTVLQDR